MTQHPQQVTLPRMHGTMLSVLIPRSHLPSPSRRKLTLDRIYVFDLIVLNRAFQRGNGLQMGAGCMSQLFNQAVTHVATRKHDADLSISFSIVEPAAGSPAASVRSRPAVLKATVGLRRPRRAAKGRGQDFTAFFNATAFMQYRNPLGSGPSGKTWPRCASHVLQIVSTRFKNAGPSKRYAITLGVNGCVNDGQPVPDSNFSVASKRTLPQHRQE